MSDRTRLSLFYPASYLTMCGLGLTFFPDLALRLFFSSGHYDQALVRFSGLLVLGLAALVIQVIRLRLSSLYPTLVAVRFWFCAGYAVLYAQTGDPFFLAVLGMVGAGVIASSVTLMTGPTALAGGGKRGKPA